MNWNPDKKNIFFLCLSVYFFQIFSFQGFCIGIFIRENHIVTEGLHLDPHTSKNIKNLSLQEYKNQKGFLLSDFQSTGSLSFSSPPNSLVYGLEITWCTPEKHEEMLLKFSYFSNFKRHPISRNFLIAPHFEWQKTKFWFPWWEPSQKIPTNLLLASNTDTKILITSIRLIASTVKTSPLSSEFLTMAGQRYSSLLENPYALTFLCFIFLWILLKNILLFRKKIRSRFQLGLLLPPFLIFIALIFLSQDYFLSMQQAEISRIQHSLQEKYYQTFVLFDDIQGEFSQIIEKNKKDLLHCLPEILELLKTHPHEKMSLEKQMEPKCEQIHKTIIKKEGNLEFSFSLTNGESHFTTYKDEEAKQIQMIQLLRQLFRIMIQNHRFSPSASEIEILSEMATEVRNLIATDIQSAILLDEFMAKPGQLFEITFRANNKIGYSSDPSFWSWIEDSKKPGKEWFLTGSFSSEKIANAYMKNFFTLSKFWDNNIQVLFSGLHNWISFPQTENFELLDELASAFRQIENNSFVAVWDEKNLYFSYLGAFEPARSYHICLTQNADPLFRKIYLIKNLVWFTILGFLLLILLVSTQAAKAITKPLGDLQNGLVKIIHGDLNSDLFVTQKNQIGDLTKLFNDLLKSLREQKIVQQFLSSMAQEAMKNEIHSVREEVVILFCAITNHKELLNTPKTAKEIFSSFLKIVGESITKSNGQMDKFTGYACLCIFRGAQKETNALCTTLCLAKYLQKSFNNQVRFSFGMANGPVVLGHVGAKNRKDFTCIGSTVNFAARLQDLGKQKNFSIFLSASMYQKLDHEAIGQTIKNLYHEENSPKFVLHPQVFLKGIREGQNIYELS